MTDTAYQEFLSRKAFVVPPTGMTKDYALSDALFEWQRDIVKWALRKGRAAIFADCGLGKTLMQLEWARVVFEHVGPVLILCPLAVAAQTVAEAKRFGITDNIRYQREQSKVCAGITVTNYEMLDRFDPAAFDGVVLDESSILKAYDSKTRNQILFTFACTPFRLACTATPAPNDFVELGNHSEFMGALTRPEMLATFFTHDGGDTSHWRLKGHAQGEFWRWVASWAVMLRKPSDLGYDDAGFNLPALQIHEHKIETGKCADGYLFPMPAIGLNDQRAAKRSTLADRVRLVADMVNASPGSWLVWCELNDEGNALAKAIDGAVQVAGADKQDDKIARMQAFTSGEARVLVSKGSICGWGMNWQHCHQMAFVGMTHSYETFYQSVRRCWRFGQTQPVDCHIVVTDLEDTVWHNVQRKQADADRMAAAMVGAMAEESASALHSSQRNNDIYRPTKAMLIPAWLRSEAS